MERKRLGLDKPLALSIRRLDGRARQVRSRQVDVDRTAGDRGDLDPARIVAGGGDSGDHIRHADIGSAGDAGRALPRHLDRLRRPHRDHRRIVDSVVLVRHAHHIELAVFFQLAAADHFHADLRGSGGQSHAADLAGDGGRLPLLRRDRAHDPLVAAGSNERGLHPHRARQGRVREARRFAPRAA